MPLWQTPCIYLLGDKTLSVYAGLLWECFVNAWLLCTVFNQVVYAGPWNDLQDIGNMYSMFHTRSTLHQRAYKHKTTLAVEQMYANQAIAI